MKNILKTFEPNEKGRDFVISDVHGSASILEDLLKNIQFDEENDRLFSVGDLVDRGPESLKVLGYLRKPWFHAVLANHEQMMYEAFNGGYMGAYWWQNGGVWGMQAFTAARQMEQKKNGSIDAMPIITDDDYELFDLLVKVEDLPFLITINHKSGKKFHIIHAELPPNHFGLTDADLADPVKVEKLATTHVGDGDSFVWGRYLFMPFYKADLNNRAKMIRVACTGQATKLFNDNLSHIISGHTILQRPVTLVGQTNIDTGAYASYGSGKSWPALTCINLDTWEFFQQTEEEFRKVDPFVINRADIEAARAPKS